MFTDCVSGRYSCHSTLDFWSVLTRSDTHPDIGSVLTRSDTHPDIVAAAPDRLTRQGSDSVD